VVGSVALPRGTAGRPVHSGPKKETEVTESYERPNPATVVEVLQGTKDYLQQHGRTQGANVRSDGRACLNGALYIAAGILRPDTETYEYDPRRHSLYYQAYGELRWAVRSTTTYTGLGPITFNDGPDTTDEQVYEVIDAAIAAQTQETTQ
jgi:hypothetical protein